MQAPVVPMSFLRAKPIGVMPMIDQGEQDDKIIAVHADDPEFRDYNDINELPKHRLAEIKRYCMPCTLPQGFVLLSDVMETCSARRGTFAEKLHGPVRIRHVQYNDQIGLRFWWITGGSTAAQLQLG